MPTSTSLSVNKSKGFTLVELLVAISIVAILSVIGLTTYAGVQARARDSRRMDDLRKIQLALELYHNEFGRYPESPNIDPFWSYSGPGDRGFWLSDVSGDDLTSKYIIKMPVDPKNTCTLNTNPIEDTNCFVYGYYSGDWCELSTRNDGYILTARLEAHSGSDLSQQPFYNCLNGVYNADSTKFSNWAEAAVDGIYVVRNP